MPCPCTVQAPEQGSRPKALRVRQLGRQLGARLVHGCSPVHAAGTGSVMLWGQAQQLMKAHTWSWASVRSLSRALCLLCGASAACRCQERQQPARLLWGVSRAAGGKAIGRGSAHPVVSGGASPVSVPRAIWCSCSLQIFRCQATGQAQWAEYTLRASVRAAAYGHMAVQREHKPCCEW